MSQADPKPPAALAASDLSTGYPGALIIDGLDLEIPRATFTALVGPNGCGKSTLLRAVARLQPLHRGTVLLDGRAIAQQSTKEIARQVGILPQAPEAPEGLSVADLVRQGRYPHRALFGRWAEADARACADALDVTGLTSLQDRPLDSLSGGQKQRAWIAMTLAQQTAMLLLDEPTTYLDLAHQLEVLDLLRALVKEQGATVVAVLHDLNQAARYADHIVMMKDGAILAEGAPDATVTQARIEAVFDIKAMVMPNPVDGTPLMIAVTRR
ncbi:ABC transporter ATP-binding protein [Amorphus sp. 3PC139-8]|uniref:ABC transporter ATP-binding protein n=1 Tax=Amorphus sp. 3PC139-8 TaxID=2735676 RepID=UPI00345D1F90